MRCTLGLGLNEIAAFGRPAFTPAALPGISAWYDPSDLSTLFQDAAGTTPVTTAGDPVGLMLDKSGNGNHATQSTSNARPTLQEDGNGRRYLSFDGVDDLLVSASIGFNAGGELTVGVAAQVDTPNTSAGVLVELSANWNTNAGTMLVLTGVNINGTGDGFSSASRGTEPAAPGHYSYSAANYPRGAPYTVRSNNSIIPASTITYVNGAASTESTYTKGTGTFGAYPLYIGGRSGGTFAMSGRIYGLVAVSSLLDATTNASFDGYLANKAGITL